MYELKIGHHLLKGKIMDLAKPLLFTEKIINDQGNHEYQIKAIIKRKLLFATRPTPLRNNGKPNEASLVQNNTK